MINSLRNASARCQSAEDATLLSKAADYIVELEGKLESATKPVATKPVSTKPAYKPATPRA